MSHAQGKQRHHTAVVRPGRKKGSGGFPVPIVVQSYMPAHDSMRPKRRLQELIHVVKVVFWEFRASDVVILQNVFNCIARDDPVVVQRFTDASAQDGAGHIIHGVGKIVLRGSFPRADLFVIEAHCLSSPAQALWTSVR